MSPVALTLHHPSADDSSMIPRSIPSVLTGSLACCVFLSAAPSTIAGETHVSIVDGKWQINGRPTYVGAPAEGLLMNVRVVNAVFEDAKRPDFDADANTDEFIAHIADYVAQ